MGVEMIVPRAALAAPFAPPVWTASSGDWEWARDWAGHGPDWMGPAARSVDALPAEAESAFETVAETPALEHNPFVSELADVALDTTVVPEPATLWLLASGLIALGTAGLVQRRRGG
jgi:hypothetical protein